MSMLDIEKEISIMKRRILALEQTLDKVGEAMKKKDNEIEELKKRVQYMEFKDRPLCYLWLRM
jgi:predicted  nucleic acid-binding Zn-ribbon protein